MGIGIIALWPKYYLSQKKKSLYLTVILNGLEIKYFPYVFEDATWRYPQPNWELIPHNYAVSEKEKEKLASS